MKAQNKTSKLEIECNCEFLTKENKCSISNNKYCVYTKSKDYFCPIYVLQQLSEMRYTF